MSFAYVHYWKILHIFLRLPYILCCMYSHGSFRPQNNFKTLLIYLKRENMPTAHIFHRSFFFVYIALPCKESMIPSKIMTFYKGNTCLFGGVFIFFPSCFWISRVYAVLSFSIFPFKHRHLYLLLFLKKNESDR